MAAGTLKQSDIYVPLAFAAADVLFELKTDGRITFAVGAAMSLLGRPARLLAELSLTDIVADNDRQRLERSLGAMARGQRVRNVLLEVTRPDRDPTQVMLSGYAHPDKAGHLVAVMAHAVGFLPPRYHYDTPSGLMDKEAFASKVQGLLGDPSGGDAYHMTLLELPEMAAVRDRLGPTEAEAFVQRLGERLRALSVGGDAAAQLGDSKYGVVHSGEIDEAAISSAIAETCPVEIAPKTSTLTLDIGDMAAGDAARALAYTLNSFAKDGAESLELDTIQASIKPRLSETVREMKAVRAVIESGDFQIVYQPIVDLRTNIVHHFETLVRFGDGSRSPYDTVVFAEDTGLVGELDMAVLDRVMKTMRTGAATEDVLRFAVNLSGRSMGDPHVTQRLRAAVANASDLRKRLLFEVTESYAITDLPAVNAVIQELRRAGFEVCLDDFGAGSAAFHYLRALKVDHVKIDGSYVKDCMKNNESVAFLEAMVGLCTKLGVTTIAEYVEDADTAALLKLLKVRFGQGYHFGKPFAVEADHLSAWAQTHTEWRRGLLVFKG